MVSIDPQSPNIAQGVDTSARDAHGQERRGHPQQPGRRRPGDDVRLRVRRDRRPHAAADLARAPARPSPRARCARPASSRTCVRTGRRRSRSTTRTASRCSCKTVLISTQHAPEPRSRDAHQARPQGARDPPVAPAAVRGRRLRRAREPDRLVRARRPARRHRPHGPQDHRRHLRRHGPPRRRRVLGEGPVEGRPLGCVRGALGREARRRGGRRRLAARSRSPTRSAWRVRSRSWSRRSVPSGSIPRRS